VTPTARLIEVVGALNHAGIRFLIMGGHAVRYYGIDRNTSDFDFHIGLEGAEGLESRLKLTQAFGPSGVVASTSWRGDDFFRFEIGKLPNGREEWMEFWVRNHLLPPFDELYGRREEQVVSNNVLSYLALADLIQRDSSH
jgi:hypothetical protein